LVDIFYPSVETVFSREGVFQQPQAIALRTQPEAMPTVIEEGFTSGTLEL
jgi:hypothetical protein